MLKTLLLIATDYEVDLQKRVQQRCQFANCLTGELPETKGLFSIYPANSYQVKVYHPRANSLINAIYTQGVDAVLLTFDAGCQDMNESIQKIILWLNDLLDRDVSLPVFIVGYSTHAEINQALDLRLKQLCQQWGLTYVGVVKINIPEQCLEQATPLHEAIKRILDI